VRNLANRFLLQ
jgi:hypothetical protein